MGGGSREMEINFWEKWKIITNNGEAALFLTIDSALQVANVSFFRRNINASSQWERIQNTIFFSSGSNKEQASCMSPNTRLEKFPPKALKKKIHNFNEKIIETSSIIVWSEKVEP